LPRNQLATTFPEILAAFAVITFEVRPDRSTLPTIKKILDDGAKKLIIM
jgi:hypothetical protein